MLLYLFYLASKLTLFLLGGRRRSVDSGAVSLAYYRLGPEDGEPWVLLHGLGSTAVGWLPVLRALRGDCRLIVPELSALGGTRAPGDALSLRLASQVLAELIEKELGGRPVTLAGLSLGGWMAVRLALDRPDLVSRLLLIDAGGYRNQDWRAIESLVRVADLDGVDRLYKALFAQTPWIMERTRPGFLAVYTSPAVRNTLDQLAEGDAYDDADLARIRVPTGLIWGEHDGLFTVGAARAMAAALPRASLEVLPGIGHAVHLERPGLLIGAIQRFRRRTAPVPLAAEPRAALD